MGSGDIYFDRAVFYDLGAIAIAFAGGELEVRDMARPGLIDCQSVRSTRYDLFHAYMGDNYLG